MTKKYETIREIKERGENAIGKSIKELVTIETLKNWYLSPKNKGWLGNAIEKDWFGLENNNLPQADFKELGVELKSTGLKFFKREKIWAAKERLVLNHFNYDEEYKKEFLDSTFYKKSNLIELIFYKYDPINYFKFQGKLYPTYPDFVVTHSFLLNLKDLPPNDLAIIENDWNLIKRMIIQGRAEYISEGMTQYLGAVTKGSKTIKNQVSQPFSKKKAHRRAFSLKPSYMKELTKQIVNGEIISSKSYESYENDYLDSDNGEINQVVHTRENIINDLNALKQKTFEEIILDKFKPFYGKKKKDLAKELRVEIKKINDKASSRLIAQKMFNLENDLEETEEFKKAGISLKIITVKSTQRKKISNNRMTTEAFKLESNLEFIQDIINLDWKTSRVYDYLHTTKFLLVVFERTSKGDFFKGCKFWYMSKEDLKIVGETWKMTKNILKNGLTLTYKEVKKKKEQDKGYKVKNNLPSQSTGPNILHIRPSAKKSDYYESINSSRLPTRSTWEGRPNDMKDKLTDFYMVKQAFWLNKDYMYQQVKEFFE